MSPNTWYWTAALVDLSLATACLGLGWQAIRKHRLEVHRRWMNAAVCLVLAFLASYPAKVVWLGKENLDLWHPSDVTILRIHETFVLLMLLTGGSARWLARRLHPGSLRVADARWRAWHRWCGRWAVVFSILGLLTAVLILIGMHARTV